MVVALQYYIFAAALKNLVLHITTTLKIILKNSSELEVLTVLGVRILGNYFSLTLN